MLLIVDIGNTNVKFGLFNNNKLLNVYTIPTHTYKMGSIKATIPAKMKPIEDIYVGSVVPSANVLVIDDIYKTYKIRPQLINGADFKAHFDLAKFDINEIGIDILGYAMFIKSNYKSGVGICFGTATFAVAVDNNKIYGVAIAPSIELGIQHLSRRAELIHNYQVNKIQKIFGFNTSTAIASGAAHMAEGFVQSVAAYAKQKYHINDVYVSGGKSIYLQTLESKNIHFIHNAILLGYFELLKTKVQ
jgi:type III pantothenate kinase